MVRDRLIGIALGLVVFGIINSRLWPVTSLETTRAKLASVLRSLAKLAGLPDADEDHAPRLTEAYGLRLRVYQEFGAVRQLLESSKFEFGVARRERLEAVSYTVQMFFLHLLAIIQHRPDLRPSAVPEPLRAASAKFRATLIGVLLNLSDRVEGRSARAMPDLPLALAELKKNVAAQIRARLALYQETVPFAMKLIRLQAG